MKTDDDPGGQKSKHSGNGLRPLAKNAFSSPSSSKGQNSVRKKRLRRTGSGDGFSLEFDQKSPGKHYASGIYAPFSSEDETHSQYAQHTLQATPNFYYNQEDMLSLAGKAYYQNTGANNAYNGFSSSSNKIVQVKELLDGYNALEDFDDLQARLEMILQQVSRNQTQDYKDAVRPTNWLCLLKYF